MVDNVLSNKERAEQDPIGHLRQAFHDAFVPEETENDAENELYEFLHKSGLDKEQILEVDELIGDVIDYYEQRGFRQGYSVATNIMANAMTH